MSLRIDTMSSSEKPNTWTDDPEQEVSNKRKSHPALSAPGENWDWEWYKKQKACVGYDMAYIINLHKRPGLFSKKKRHIDSGSNVISIITSKITELSRQKGPPPKKKGNYWKLRATIDDFPIELSIPHNPLGILHQKESIFLFEKAANLCTKIIFFFTPTHLVDSNRQSTQEKNI